MEFSKKQERLIEQARKVLQPEENVIDVTTGRIQVNRLGADTSRSGTVLVTDRRVILFTKKIGGYEMNDHVYGLLTALDYKKGIMCGRITLAASGDRTHVSMVPTEDVERVAKAIRERIAAAHNSGNSSSSTQFSVADEIRKLAELLKEGIISEAEFATKKSHLLNP